MGDILFKAGKQLRINTKDLSWIARQNDLTFGAARGSSTQNAPEGVDLLIGEAPEATNRTGQAEVLNAYIGRLKENKYVRAPWGGIGEQLFLVIKTNGLAGKQISANVVDRDGLLQGASMRALTVMPDTETEVVKLTGQIREDGFAVLPFRIQSKDEEKNSVWRQKIGEAEGKIVPVCVLIDAHTENSDLTIKYYGHNPDGDTGPTAGKSNYWLDTESTWFELRRKNPVIILDPGHGYKRGSTGTAAQIYTYKLRGDDGEVRLNAAKQPETAIANVEDLPDYVISDPSTWVVSYKEDPNRPERLLVLDISVHLQALLEAEGYLVYLTRTEGGSTPIDGTDNWQTRQARMDFASEHNADYFISIHADGVEKAYPSGAHTIYKDDESKGLAEDIMRHYTIVPVESNSPKADVRGLDVLNPSKNKTERKVLVELGFITTPMDANALFLNEQLAADQLKQGIVENILKNF